MVSTYNQSRLNEYCQCPRRFFYRFVKYLEPAKDSLRMFTGTSVHAALAQYYKDPKRDIDAALSAYDCSMARLYMPGQDTDKVAKEQALWRLRVEMYPKRYLVETFDVVDVPEKEIVAAIDGFQLGMRLDLVIRRHEDGLLWVMDHKTTTKTGNSYWPQFFVDLQGSAYIYGAEQYYGEQVGGWIINGIKATKEGWYERNAFTRTADQMESFKRQTVALMREIDDRKARFFNDPDKPEKMDELFRQHTGECYGFGTCAFLPLCQAGGAALPLYRNRQLDYVDQCLNGQSQSVSLD